MASFNQNPAYAQYELLLMHLHRLIARGEGDLDEADLIREKMEGFSKDLSAVEVKRLNGLSADLYMLADDELTTQSAYSSLPLPAFHEELVKGQRRNDWERVLELLRQRPDNAPVEAVAFSRSRAYWQLGDLRAALMFLDFAAQRNPSESRYHALRLMLLQELGEHERAAADAAAFISRPGVAPEVVVAAADVLLGIPSNGVGPPQETIAQDLSRTVQATQQPSFAILGFVVLGCYYARLNQRAKALAAFDGALSLAPGDQAIAAAANALRGNGNHESSSVKERGAIEAALRRAREAVRDPELSSRHAA